MNSYRGPGLREGLRILGQVRNLGIPVLIPEEYIADLSVRMGLYRRIGQLALRDDSTFAADLVITVTLHPGHDYGWLWDAPRVLDTTYRVGAERFAWSADLTS